MNGTIFLKEERNCLMCKKATIEPVIISDYLEELFQYFAEMINTDHKIVIEGYEYNKVKLKGFYDEFGLRFYNENSYRIVYSVNQTPDMNLIGLKEVIATLNIGIQKTMRFNAYEPGKNPIISYELWENE